MRELFETIKDGESDDNVTDVCNENDRNSI